ncbi:MAG: DNA cytosine methyltransferase [Anaerobutyricum hallii]
MYYVEHNTLNAADYGVPQIRKRLVLHGIRKDVYENIGLREKKYYLCLHILRKRKKGI